MKINEIRDSMIKKVGWGFGICNQFCKHCYNSSKLSGPEYTFAQLKSIADKICPLIDDLNFGTGEFIFNPNTLDLAEYINEQYPNVRMALTSNGSTIVMMQPKKVKRLFHDVDISLDFPDEKRHCEFRNHVKAWQWVHEALTILKEENVPRTIVACITSKTTNADIEGLLDIGKTYDTNFRLNWFRCTGRGTADLKITAKRAWEIIQYLSDKVIFQCVDSVFAGPLNVTANSCPAGTKSCRIHENMEVSCYPFLKGERWSSGNILDSSVDLNTIYNSEAFSRIRNREVVYCKNCEFEHVCKGGCVTRAFLHNGDINQPDDYCPIKAGLDLQELKNITVNFSPTGNLVHDGYLCTTICKPI